VLLEGLGKVKNTVTSLGITHNLPCNFDLLDNTPVCSCPYQCYGPHLLILRDIFQDLLEKGVINPSVRAFKYHGCGASGGSIF
jgi:hypothetical protein